MQYKEIQEKFNKVISYSQGIEDPKTDNLFSRWLENKRDFIEAMDGKLLQYLKINENDKKRFIVLHITGSHYPYRHYPEEWNIYGNDNVSDNYDNTIRYTDYILKETFEKLERYNPDLFI